MKGLVGITLMLLSGFALGGCPEYLEGEYRRLHSTESVDLCALAGGKPTLVSPPHVNLGLAIDLARPDGSRTLVVPNIKAADVMDFRQFWQAYEDVVGGARGPPRGPAGAPPPTTAWPRPKPSIVRASCSIVPGS
jgi:hypothetical protein